MRDEVIYIYLTERERERGRERVMIGIRHKNVVEHGRQIIFFMRGLKYEKKYFNS